MRYMERWTVQLDLVCREEQHRLHSNHSIGHRSGGGIQQMGFENFVLIPTLHLDFFNWLEIAA